MPQPDSRRKSYILSVQPVDYSLTAGTNIPAPEHTPPPSPGRSRPKLSRPPTNSGGPLSAHPVDDSMPPPSLPGAFPSSPEPTQTTHTMSSESNRNTTDSGVRPPTSPESYNHEPTSPRERRPSSVRRLFSLNSLRQSFSSSRTSLSVPRASSSYTHRGNETYRSETPNAPSVMSGAASTMDASTYSGRNKATLKKNKRDSTWFKRKSGFFNIDEDGMLDIVDEDRENKRFKPQMPMLPEISNLGGGDLDEGRLGWDEQWFKS